MGVVAYPGRTTLIAIRCKYSSVAFKVKLGTLNHFRLICKVQRGVKLVPPFHFNLHNTAVKLGPLDNFKLYSTDGI